MMTALLRGTLILPIVALVGCVSSPQSFETPPVQVNTAKGVVTCQLYTKEITAWDRAISRPDSMSVQEGDAVCQKEGKRRKGA